MATSANTTVYRKTASGQAEMARRQAGLTPRARMVLVVVNGSDTQASLVERLGAEVPAVLQQLADKGLIEVATAVGAAPVPVPAQTTTQTPAQTPAPPAPPAAEAKVFAAGPTPSAMLALVQLLLPHFGPDATRVADAALRAASHAEFNAALDDVAGRLAIHLGRKQADQLLAPLRLPVG